MVPAPHTNHHVLMMRHLLDQALQLHVKPTYTAVISLLQKVIVLLLVFTYVLVLCVFTGCRL